VAWIAAGTTSTGGLSALLEKAPWQEPDLSLPTSYCVDRLDRLFLASRIFGQAFQARD
jgi:hypothetical protein